MNPGLIGGIIGGVAGIIGGVIGTYCSIKNTNGPKERNFIIKASLICWVMVSAFMVLLFVLPAPYKWMIWIPYCPLLVWGINASNRIQRKIREEEAKNTN